MTRSQFIKRAIMAMAAGLFGAAARANNGVLFTNCEIERKWVEWNIFNESEFRLALRRIRAEHRIALAKYRPRK